MRGLVLAALTVAVVALGVSVVAVVVGRAGSPSMSSRVSDRLDVSADCQKAGVQEMAGQRERVYLCSYDLPDAPGRFATPCWAVIDGDLVDVTDEVSRTFPDCSHVAQYRDQ